jgi:hypothetical protein
MQLSAFSFQLLASAFSKEAFEACAGRKKLKADG